VAKLIGIDDAGRGPVIGPMVLAGILINEKEEKEITELGAKDSKLLLSKKRREIRNKLFSRYESHIEVSSPKEIDESSNLNYLEAIKTAMIINKLSTGFKEPITAIVDCPSTNIKSWSEDVRKLLDHPEIINLQCEHKADANHPVVSAASIIAKERREDEIEELKRKLGIDFGSGYPSDPATIKFIKENFRNERYKDIIRFSWKTVKNLFDEGNQKKLF